MQQIIIADDCVDFGLMLAGLLRTKYRLEVFRDGKAVLEHLRQSPADLLIVDLMLPSLDGLELVQTARREQLAAAVIVTGRVFSEYVLAALEALQVDYAVKKPCSSAALAARAEELCERIQVNAENEPHCAVSDLLLALGFRMKTKGFRYSRDAIILLAEDPALQMTKNVYPEVGKTWGAKGQAVEKAIRTAIAGAWENRDERVWKTYFSCKPTNTEFLIRLADAVALTTGRKRA